ncbi:MAG: hypothetical protein MSQ05_07660 [Akkermansia sp.]|nr:hypothetical protein [Akkermansia sp.]
MQMQSQNEESSYFSAIISSAMSVCNMLQWGAFQVPSVGQAVSGRVLVDPFSSAWETAVRHGSPTAFLMLKQEKMRIRLIIYHFF